MKSRKYIAILSLAAVAVVGTITALACIEFFNDGYASAPFIVSKKSDDDTAGNRHAYRETLDFWQQYTHNNVPREEIKRFFDEVSIDSLPTKKYQFYNYLTARDDRQALDYLALCLRLQNTSCPYNSNDWDYERPSTGSLDALLSKVEAARPNSTFKPRYTLLKMRIHAAKGDDNALVDTWHREGEKLPPSALRDRMEGYIGGVLYRQGRYPEALEYFYNSNDNNSVQWCVEKLAGSANLTKLYEHAPNSRAIVYILEDYVNYLIAVTDGGRATNDDDSDSPIGFYGRSYNVRDDVAAMEALCERVLSEGKTTSPMLWATTLGVLQGIDGNHAEALRTLDKASQMQGDNYMLSNLDNFTLWALMLNSGRGDVALDERFAVALRQAYRRGYDESFRVVHDFDPSKEQGEVWGIDKSIPTFQFLNNFLAEEARAHYYALKQPQRAMAFTAMIDEMPISGHTIDRMQQLRGDIFSDRPLRDGLEFHAYAADENPSNPIDKFLQPFAAKQTNLINDAIGTRLMVEGLLEKALPFLSAVDPRWLPTQSFYPYIGSLYYPQSYEFKNSGHNYGQWHTSSRDGYNYKAAFCSQLIRAMHQYELLTGNAKAEKAYEIAAMYHFGSPTGKSWALSDYKWTILNKVNDFTREANRWLDNCLGLTRDPMLKVKASYALLALPGEKIEHEYYTEYAQPFGIFSTDESYSGKSCSIHYFLDRPTLSQSAALRVIKSYWALPDKPYHVSNCDILKSYVYGTFSQRPANYYD